MIPESYKPKYAGPDRRQESTALDQKLDKAADEIVRRAAEAVKEIVEGENTVNTIRWQHVDGLLNGFDKTIRELAKSNEDGHQRIIEANERMIEKVATNMKEIMDVNIAFFKSTIKGHEKNIEEIRDELNAKHQENVQSIGEVKKDLKTLRQDFEDLKNAKIKGKAGILDKVIIIGVTIIATQLVTFGIDLYKAAAVPKKTVEEVNNASNVQPQR